MPIVNGAYDAPTWNNNAPPAIDASELQDMCDTIETYNTQKADVDYVNTFVRPNLLDNAYFVGGGSQQGGGQFPINQRGSTSHSGIGYTFDRWKATGGDTTVAIGSDGVTLTCPTRYAGIYQYLEQPPTGKPCALSILSTEGLSWQIFTFPSSGTATVVYLTDFYVEIGTNYVAVLRRVTGSASIKIHALKLELGSTQTLAHQENGTWVLNEVPNFQQELAKCRRYAYRNTNTSSEFIRAGNVDASSIAFDIPCSVPLRTNPTYTAMTSTDAMVVKSYGGTNQTGFSFALIAMGSSIRVIASKSAHGLTDAALVVTGTLFSADL